MSQSGREGGGRGNPKGAWETVGRHPTEQHTQVPDEKLGEERRPEEIMAKPSQNCKNNNNKQQQHIQEAPLQGEQVQPRPDTSQANCKKTERLSEASGVHDA